MKLLNDPMVKLLIDKFDIETPPINVLEISKYELDGDCIKIKEIKVLDIDMNFVRFANINKVLPYLSSYYTVFNDRATDPVETNKET